jgi:hypothetical protein
LRTAGCFKFENQGNRETRRMGVSLEDTPRTFAFLFAFCAPNNILYISICYDLSPGAMRSKLHIFPKRVSFYGAVKRQEKGMGQECGFNQGRTRLFGGGDLRGVSLLLRATSATMKLSRRDDPNGYAGAG